MDFKKWFTYACTNTLPPWAQLINVFILGKKLLILLCFVRRIRPYLDLQTLYRQTERNAMKEDSGVLGWKKCRFVFLIPVRFIYILFEARAQVHKNILRFEATVLIPLPFTIPLDLGLANFFCKGPDKRFRPVGHTVIKCITVSLSHRAIEFPCVLHSRGHYGTQKQPKTNEWTWLCFNKT